MFIFLYPNRIQTFNRLVIDTDDIPLLNLLSISRDGNWNKYYES